MISAVGFAGQPPQPRRGAEIASRGGRRGRLRLRRKGGAGDRGGTADDDLASGGAPAVTDYALILRRSRARDCGPRTVPPLGLTRLAAEFLLDGDSVAR